MKPAGRTEDLEGSGPLTLNGTLSALVSEHCRGRSWLSPAAASSRPTELGGEVLLIVPSFNRKPYLAALFFLVKGFVCLSFLIDFSFYPLWGGKISLY